MKITQVKIRRRGSNDWRYVPGFSATCSQCNRTWGFANVSVTQAKKQGLDKCPQCGRQGSLTSISVENKDQSRTVT